jgi:hypothetical protein
MAVVQSSPISWTQSDIKVKFFELPLVGSLVKSGIQHGRPQQCVVFRFQALFKLCQAQQAFSIAHRFTVKGIFSLENSGILAQPQLGLEICPLSDFRQGFIHFQV